MPLWVGDFLTKTISLDTRETGAYMLLLMAMWTNGGSLPEDHKKLQRIARAGRDWPTIWRGIEGFFKVENGVITQSRLTEELQKVCAKREANSRSGALGGKAKALKEKGVALANATISPQQSYSEPESKGEAKASLARKRGGDDPAFAEFWAIYPRKVAKGAARKAWAKATRTSDPPTIIAAASRVEDRGQYTPHPASWLNAERWLDEPEKPHEPTAQQSPRRPGGSSLFDAAARLSDRFAASRGDCGDAEGDDPGGPGTHRASGGASVVALLAAG